MSDLRANTISNLAGTGPATLTKQSAAKAWVNFNGTGTIATRDSFNVSSLTDNGTGIYAVNLTDSMSNADYSGFCSGRFFGVFDNSGGNTASSVEVRTLTAAGAFIDSDPVTAATYGDLA